MLIPLILITAAGITTIFSKHKLVGFLVIGLVIFNSLSFLRFYTHNYPFAQLWGQPQRDFVNRLDPSQFLTIPDKFYVNLVYYAFEFRLDPRQLQQAIVTRRLGNLYFADE